MESTHKTLLVILIFFSLEFHPEVNETSWIISYLVYTQSVLIRNGPIRSSSEILAFFKKWPVELSKLRNGEITFQIFKKFTSESFQFKKWSRIAVS